MKKSLFLFIVFSAVIFWSSCQKEGEEETNDTFVKVLKSDSDFASAGMAKLDDGNYVFAGFEYRTEYPVPRNPVRIVKTDANGKVIWDKRMPASGSTIYKIMAVPGTGFLTLGVSDFFSNRMEICMYNFDGELISGKKVYLNTQNDAMLPFDMIRLSNGNYALAGENWLTQAGVIIILSPAFDSLYYREIGAIANFQQVGLRCLCETKDGNITLAANTMRYSVNFDTAWLMPAIIKTDLTGVLNSFDVREELTQFVTPHAIAPYRDGFVTVTSSFAGYWQEGGGCEVNYDLHYNMYGFGSGKINIERYGNDGSLADKKAIKDYPRNGLIHSMHPTRDGGFICCGTVDQADSYYMLSDTKIYLLKLDADLNTQWARTIRTAYQSFGVEAMQTPDGGYLVSAYHRSMEERFEMMIIKTDASGNY